MHVRVKRACEGKACSARIAPRVLTATTCVSPRVNSALPCVRGNSPHRLLIGRTWENHVFMCATIRQLSTCLTTPYLVNAASICSEPFIQHQPPHDAALHALPRQRKVNGRGRPLPATLPNPHH